MRKSILCLSVFILALCIRCNAGGYTPAPTESCADTYQQCGGIGASNRTCCCDTDECEVLTLWYFQCLPKTTQTPSFTPTEVPSHYPTSTPTSTCAKSWEQCAGVNFNNKSCCDECDECEFVNDWYSQCKPQTTSSPSVEPSRSRTRAPTASCAMTYEQCGGRENRTCCSISDECEFVNDWYSQCKPRTTRSPSVEPSRSRSRSPTPSPTRKRSPSPTPAPTRKRSPSPTPAPTRKRSPSPTKAPAKSPTVQPTPSCASTWQQCAGADFGNTTCCDPCDECIYVNEWYSQCLTQPTQEPAAIQNTINVDSEDDEILPQK